MQTGSFPLRFPQNRLSLGLHRYHIVTNISQSENNVLQSLLLCYKLFDSTCHVEGDVREGVGHNRRFEYDCSLRLGGPSFPFEGRLISGVVLAVIFSFPLVNLNGWSDKFLERFLAVGTGAGWSMLDPATADGMVGLASRGAILAAQGLHELFRLGFRYLEVALR